MPNGALSMALVFDYINHKNVQVTWRLKLLTLIDRQFFSWEFGNFTITFFDPALSSLSFRGRKRHTTRILSSAILRSADMFNHIVLKRWIILHKFFFHFARLFRSEHHLCWQLLIELLVFLIFYTSKQNNFFYIYLLAFLREKKHSLMFLYITLLTNHVLSIRNTPV